MPGSRVVCPEAQPLDSLDSVSDADDGEFDVCSQSSGSEDWEVVDLHVSTPVSEAHDPDLQPNAIQQLLVTGLNTFIGSFELLPVINQTVSSGRSAENFQSEHLTAASYSKASALHSEVVRPRSTHSDECRKFGDSVKASSAGVVNAQAEADGIGVRVASDAEIDTQRVNASLGRTGITSCVEDEAMSGSSRHLNMQTSTANLAHQCQSGPLTASCQCPVCSSPLLLYPTAPWGRWSCDTCGRKDFVEADSLWGCRTAYKCDFAMCRDCYDYARSNSKGGKGGHLDLVCDGCGMFPLVGPRFQCRDFPSYDLCAKCHQMRPQQNMDRQQRLCPILTSVFSPMLSLLSLDLVRPLALVN